MRARAWVPVVLGLTLALGAVPARADAACAWDGAGHVMTVTSTGGFVSIERDGGAIEVNGSLCWGSGLSFATLNATRRIVVNGGDGDDNVTIMLREGRFNAAEATGLDADVRASGLAFVYAMGWLGDDEISAVGGRATGTVLPLPIALQGAEGDDRLTGGAAADELGDETAGGDADVLRGRGGADTLTTLDVDGLDEIWGGGGTDSCFHEMGDALHTCEPIQI